MVEPTIAVSGVSKVNKRRLLAKRYHIHTVVTCHLPSQINMSQNTNINESIFVARRHEGAKPDTRFVHLDRFPKTEHEALDLCSKLRNHQQLDEGWGEVSYWPAERMAEGDWSPGIWRDPKLASAAWQFAKDPNLISLGSIEDVYVHATGRTLRGNFEPTAYLDNASFPILKSKGADSQQRLKSTPDEHWQVKKPVSPSAEWAVRARDMREKILAKAGYLLVTAGHRLSTSRLTAVADGQGYVGNGWMPVSGVSLEEAKALALFLNSTPGRILIMLSPGKTLEFPTYSAKENSNLKVPNVRNDSALRATLAKCYEETCDVPVPQFRDGECEVRAEWDRCVGKAMGWDPDYLRETRLRLHREPIVRSLGRDQYREASSEAV